uniref:Uncharacterized protein AlNc14C41G3515 n=1 Tax=Albugo laibachii Nc14 TaxID=890382 RepID=F0W9R1_9STRA|nr:conserved hypothetical protein [Albugo laibachii Nc14]|eukprot:CCA17879.1 conserved hypothetical protein [Albugo laibachii Nc14]
MADLTCSEEYGPESPSKHSIKREEHKQIHTFSFDIQRVIQMQLYREEAGAYLIRNANYLHEIQKQGMEASWRRKICHWMFETGKAFELSVDTVGCAVYYMDQYLSRYSVDKVMLQMLSLVCMGVASKMHERYPITMEEMEVLSQKKFSCLEIGRLERQLLHLIEWKLSPPCAFTFAKTFLEGVELSREEREEITEAVCDLLQEVTEEYHSIQIKSSLLGFGAVHVIWNAKRLRSSSYLKSAFTSFHLPITEKDFIESYRFILQLHHTKSQMARFISVEESKSDVSRSVSPTSVDDTPSLIRHLEDDALFDGMERSSKRQRV